MKLMMKYKDLAQSVMLLLAVSLILAMSGCASRDDDGVAEADSLSVEASRAISTELSNQRVKDFAEDADGYMWIATHRGLNRYNGRDFHQYYCTDDSTSLPDNQLNFVYRDSRDRMWVGSVNGTCYYTDADNFHRVKMKGDTSRNGMQMVENSHGRLFLNLVGSFLVFNEEKDSFDIEVPLNINDAYTMRMYIDDDDNLWTVSGISIKKFDSNTLELKDSIPIDRYMYLSCRMGDEIWLYDSGEFRRFSLTEGRFMPVPEAVAANAMLRDSHVNCISSYRDSYLEIFTYDGVFSYDPQEDVLGHQSDMGFEVAKDEFYATTAYTDSKGNMWLGSDYQGFVVRSAELKTFNSNTGLTALMQGKAVQCVINDGNDNIWMTSAHNGVYRYNAKTSEAQHFDIAAFFPGRKNGECNAYSLYFDRDGYLWMCMDNNMLARFLYANGRLQLKDWYYVFMPLSVYQDSDGTVWIGTYSDLIYSMARGETGFTVSRTLNVPFSYTSLLTELRDGTPVALSWAVGIQKLHSGQRTLEWSQTLASNVQASLRRSIFLPTCLLEDSRGRIWLGTVANGILLFHRDTETVERIDGISCTDVCSMEEDADGNIWVSTMNGLVRLDTESMTFHTYYASDGLVGNQFYDRSSCKLSDGTLLFGGTQGITVFMPSEEGGHEQLNLVLEDLKIHNGIVEPERGGSISTRLAKADKISLDYKQNGFSISYAALDLDNSVQMRYQYKMDGFDRYWVDAGTGREAYYANLPAGNYTFCVRAADGQGDVVGETAITVKVSSAPWLSWWAMLLYLVAIVALVWFIVNSYIRVRMSRQEAKQAEREKEHERYVNQMNMNFFANVSHEFRTPLTIISGPIEQLCDDSTISGESKHLLYIVRRSVSRMLRLVNQMLEFHKLENDTIKLCVRQTDVTALLQQFTDIFTVNAHEKNISFSVYGVEDSFTAWVDADKVEKITTNLLSNAFKFTPAGGKIVFSFDVISRQEAAGSFPLTESDTDTQYIKVSVKDSGSGIPLGEEELIFGRYYQLDKFRGQSSQIGSGIGLNYAHSLVRLHHGYIKAENRSDGQPGAVFSFILPASEASYAVAEKGGKAEQEVLFPLQDMVTADVQEDEEGEDSRKKILIVDDDIDVMNYLRALLSGDYHVTTCFDAQSGLKSMQDDAPDLVISDVLMPGINGYEFCRQIKGNIQLSHIPVILVTAKASTDNQIEGLDSGADAYVVKPFAPSYLKALIHSLLENRERVRQILVKSTQTEEVPQDMLSPQDKSLMTELYSIMEKELSNPELDVTRMTEMLHISRTKLYYKIKGLTGMNPSVFFRCYKLNRAAELIKEGKYNISEISYMTGFSTLSHFSTSFKKQFGVNPSEYK